MAIEQSIWDKAKALFELGYTLQEIELETEINKSSISKKAKKENWEKSKNQQLKSDIVEWEIENSKQIQQKSTLVEKMASLTDFEITILDEVVQEETKMKTLITSTASLALIRINQSLTKNTKQVAMKVTDYSNGKPVGQSIEFVEMELESQDIKNHTESIDKLSVTTGVNDRFSKSTVEINNANIQQENKKEIVYKVVS